MSLEVSTYISGLTPSWPPSGDPKSQGDDHIRLIKSVLQNTFPAADKAFYFPKAEASAGTMVLDATDQNNTIFITTTGGDVAVTLPSTLTSANIGWECEITKVSADTNAAVVSPSSGTISSQVGATATIRVGALNQPARFIWTGSTWICVKPGIAIGQTGNFDGAIPYGFLALDGSSYSSTTFAELFAVLATTTLKDKRGRVEAGVDGGAGRLTSSYFGTTATAGAVGGLESHLLTGAQSGVAAHQHDVFLKESGHVHTGAFSISGQLALQGGGTFPSVNYGGNANTGSATTGITIGSVAGVANDNRTADASAASAASSHPIVQPTIVTNKYIRAC